MEIEPIDFKKINERVTNVYEAIVAASKRARIINDQNKLEYNQQLSTIVGITDDDFEEKENPDQLKLSLDMEKRPKPHQQAMNELLNGEAKFFYKDVE
jgi:DNA-directed RNA polymerase subunit K/omega